MLRSTSEIASRALRSGLGSSGRCFTSVSLPDLPYDYGALEPHIPAEIMKLHHGAHHKTYVTNLNSTYEQYQSAESKTDVPKMIQLQQAIKFNGGGHVNHSIFWQNLTPPKDYEPPSGKLQRAIEEEFGSLDKLTTKIDDAAKGIQGSGWAWLGYNPAQKRLVVSSTANQDPLVTQGLQPLLGCDMWEHAMYLKYQNRKPEYLSNFWKVVNWKDVAERYEKVTSG
eukprot:jgi/Astpho2/2732/Aster-00913